MKRLAAIALGLLPIASCSSAELTRSAAKTLPTAHSTFVAKYTSAEWLDGGYQEYVAQGGPNNAALLQAVSGADASKIELKVPYAFVVDEITGIADTPLGQGIKQVDFRWSRVGIPDVLKPMVSIFGTGQSVFRRYDDGWRVETLSSLITNRTAPELTSTQKTQVDEFKAAELGRQQKERQAYLDLLTASKTPTKELLRGELQLVLGAYGEHAFAGGNYVVSDVSVTVSYAQQPARRLRGSFMTDEYPAREASQQVQWFGCVDGFSVAPMPTGHPGVTVILRWANELGCGAPQAWAFNVPTIEEAKRTVEEANRALTEWRGKYGHLAGGR